MSTSANPRGSRRRRMMSDINVVPYIDVTLVLLIIFMVTAPMIVTGTIDLPRVGQSSQAPAASIEVTIQQDGQISVRERKAGAPERVVSRDKLADTVKALQPSAESPVIISAEKAVRYEHVVAAMDTLQRAGIARVGLHVRVE
jgi:biopolymer transport protein TolR